jgi:hypothetical protein
MKLTNQKALELLESLPLDKVANESNFLAPLIVKGRTASTSFPDSESPSVEVAKRRIAEGLGTKNVWYEIQYDNNTGVHKITGISLDDSQVVKVVS